MSEWSKASYHLKTEMMRSQKCTCSECHRTFRLSEMAFRVVNDRLLCAECIETKSRVPQ